MRFNSGELVRALVGAACGNGLLPPGSADPARERGDKPLVVVAAAPKSGSTFLTSVLVQVTGAPFFRLCSAYSTNEHDLYLPALYLVNSTGCVSQLHMKGTFHNAALLRAFGIKPVILVRDIHDIVVSLYHDFREKERDPSLGSGFNGFSFMWQDRSTRELSEAQLLAAIVDLAVPWYVNFFVSWHDLCALGMVDALWLTYEEMMRDKRGTVARVLQFLEIKDSRPVTEEMLEQRYAKFRDGRSGGGAEVLSAEQKQRIATLFSHYRGIDFSRFGV
jgi:predicted outer membrane lipoprotein